MANCHLLGNPEDGTDLLNQRLEAKIQSIMWWKQKHDKKEFMVIYFSYILFVPIEIKMLQYNFLRKITLLGSGSEWQKTTSENGFIFRKINKNWNIKAKEESWESFWK